MNRLKYMIYCLKNMDYANMRKTVRQISRQAHRPRPLIAADLVWCGLRYQAGYSDYQDFDFYCLNSAQRKTFNTRGKNNAIVRTYNDPAYMKIFSDKSRFYEKFDRFLRRDWLNLRKCRTEELAAFLKKHSQFIAKPSDGYGGKGIGKYTTDPAEAPDKLQARLLSEGQDLVEEVIVQHPDMAALYPCSVNTLRLFTFYDGTAGHVVNAVLKMGNNGSFLDNFSSGGMYTFVDDQGVALYPAIGDGDQTFETHPMTGVKIVGFHVPLFQEAAALVTEASAVVPQCAYVGWDVAIAQSGPMIVEGNEYPGVFEPKGRFLHGELGSLARYRKYMTVKL